jgi:cell division cycle protein 20 (cofactor of APC complex)
MDFFSNTNDALFDTVFESTSTSASLGGTSTKPRWQRKQEALLSQREPLSAHKGDNTPSKRGGFGTKSPFGPGSGGGGATSSASGKSASFAPPSATKDRFIVNRASMEMGHAQWMLSKTSADAAAGMAASTRAMDTPEKAYAQEIANKLLGPEAAAAGSSCMSSILSASSSSASSAVAASAKSSSATTACAAGHNILGFKEKAPAAAAGYHESIRVLYSKSRAASSPSGKTRAALQPKRVVATTAERVLDAPELRDDYYLNLLDWSSANVLGIALDQSVYMWDATTQGITELCTLQTGYVSSLRWIQEGANTMAVGTSEGNVELWDVIKGKRLRTLNGHVGNSRVGVLAWNKYMLSSGGQDTQIVNHDVRMREHVVSRFRGHTQEVCGLTWNDSGEMLASGGNDNLVALWDARSTMAGGSSSTRGGAPNDPLDVSPQFECREHVSAVKALAWCPHRRHVLATGGGTVDKCIKTWSAVNGHCLDTLNTGSQVTQLLWNPDAPELLSAHGYSENQLTLWSYPKMQKIADLKGHTSRILSIAMSPTTGVVCSAGADETLRFWQVFGGRARANNKKPAQYTPPEGSREQYTTRLSIR